MRKAIRKYWYLKTQYVYKHKFAAVGSGSFIHKPVQLDNVSSISIGSNVYIAEGAWLMGREGREQTLSIGSNTTIGHYSHIIGLHSLTIEKDVLIADKVFISDCTHEYKDISTPVIRQKIRMLAPVRIGEGSWLGENVCICGASIGKHCVIGSNSVVTADIPDYCVAVGSPARVVKKYSFEKNEWVRV